MNLLDNPRRLVWGAGMKVILFVLGTCGVVGLMILAISVLWVQSFEVKTPWPRAIEVMQFCGLSLVAFAIAGLACSLMFFCFSSLK